MNQSTILIGAKLVHNQEILLKYVRGKFLRLKISNIVRDVTAKMKFVDKK